MQSITVQSHVGEDGILRLQIPVGVKDADLQVTINFQLPGSNGTVKSPEASDWPPSYLEKVIGSWQGEFPDIKNEGDHEKREELLSMDELEARAQSNGWPPGFFRRTAGAWLGELLERPPQGEYEVRDELL